MDYDDEYIDEESLLNDEEDELLDDADSEDYEDVDTNSGNGFSYNQNPYNRINYSQNDVNNIKERINNRRLINNNINNDASNNPNSNNKTSSDGGELSNNNSQATLQDSGLNNNSEESNSSSNDLTHEVAKKAAGKAAKAYGGKLAGDAAEKVVDSEVGRKVVDKVTNKFGKKIRNKIILSFLSLFLSIMVIMGSIAIFAFGLPAIILGVDVEDLINFGVSNDSSSYSNFDNKNYLWPIGSKETTEKNGVTFATGKPVSTSITSNYGKRKDPLTKALKPHNGIDIGDVGAGKTYVIAAKTGIVSKVFTGCKSYGSSNCGGGYGNHIIISHADGKYTVYAHLHQDTITVKKNDRVLAGQVIAKAGSSGRSTGAHLHFEVRLNSSTRTNPLNYVDPKNPRPTTTFGL